MLKQRTKGTMDTSCVKVETVGRKRSSQAHYSTRKTEKRNTLDILDKEHNIIDRAQPRSTDAASGGMSTVETNCPQCGQPSD